jgi:hypothetical protein
MHQKQLAVALLAVMAALIAATDAEAQAPAFAYAVVSPIVASGTGGRSALGFAGGAERWIDPNISAGAEVEDVYVPGEERSLNHESYSVPASNTFLLSGNLSRHFARQQATSPFITGGVSILAAAGGFIGLFNLGGGLDHRLTRRTALRLELRGGLVPFPEVLPVMLAFRAGIVFR